MWGGKERQPCGRILDWCILSVIVRVDQRLLDQQSAHAMTQQQNRSSLNIVPLYSDRLEQFVRFADERIPVIPVDCRRVVFV